MKKLLFILLCVIGCSEPAPLYTFEQAVLFYSLGYSEGRANGIYTMLCDSGAVAYSHAQRTKDSIRFVMRIK